MPLGPSAWPTLQRGQSPQSSFSKDVATASERDLAEESAASSKKRGKGAEREKSLGLSEIPWARIPTIWLQSGQR
jgi:hypothetical protein